MTRAGVALCPETHLNISTLTIHMCTKNCTKKSLGQLDVDGVVGLFLAARKEVTELQKNVIIKYTVFMNFNIQVDAAGVFFFI